MTTTTPNPYVTHAELAQTRREIHADLRDELRLFTRDIRAELRDVAENGQAGRQWAITTFVAGASVVVSCVSFFMR